MADDIILKCRKTKGGLSCKPVGKRQKRHNEKMLEFESPVKNEDNIRRRGHDVKQGKQVIRAGRRIQLQDIGFFSMLGITRVSVYRKPRVAVFSSGDELVAPGKSLGHGKIFDANIYMLSAQIVKCGGDPVILVISPDQPEQIRAILNLAVRSNSDLIVSSAGVSVGAMDFVRIVLEEHGELDFWRVNMRPGKPIAFGHYQDIPFIGLPGNPVSAVVFEVFIRPAIMKMSGYSNLIRTTTKVRLLEDVESVGIEDNVIGIHKMASTHHYGMTIMNERAKNLGGTLNIETPPASGTRVTLHFIPAGRRETVVAVHSGLSK